MTGPVNVRSHLRRRVKVAERRWKFPRGPYRKTKVLEFRTEKEARNYIRRKIRAARSSDDYWSEFRLLPDKPKRGK